MVTRIYLPTSGAARVSPAFDAAWDVTTGADRLRAVANLPSLTPFVDKATAETAAAAVNVLSRQYLAGPLAAGNIAGSVKGQILCREDNLAADMRSQISIRVVSGDGTTFRGTLRPADAEALSSEWEKLASGMRNRKIPLASLSPEALTPVAAQAGDWLVIELGYRAHNTSTAAYTGRIKYGDAFPPADDLPEDETEGADHNGWIEFSQDIPMQEIDVFQVLAEATARQINQQIQVYQVLAEVAWGEYVPPPPPPIVPPIPPFRPHAGQHGISMSVFKPRITIAP